MTQRRTDICNALSNLGVKTCCGVFFGEGLLEKQRTAKILLNVHVYPVGSLEVHRLNPVLASGMIVISEETHDLAIDMIYSDVATMVPYDVLVDAVQTKLNQSEAELKEERGRNVAWIKERVKKVDPDLCYALSRLTSDANSMLYGT